MAVTATALLLGLGLAGLARSLLTVRAASSSALSSLTTALLVGVLDVLVLAFALVGPGFLRHVALVLARCMRGVVVSVGLGTSGTRHGAPEWVSQTRGSRAGRLWRRRRAASGQRSAHRGRSRRGGPRGRSGGEPFGLTRAVVRASPSGSRPRHRAGPSSMARVDRLVAVGHPLDREAVEDRLADGSPVEIGDAIDLEGHRRRRHPRRSHRRRRG